MSAICSNPVAIIQARMTSTRLPGKVLMDLAGKPALQRMLERVSKSKRLASICVATTVNADDDPVAALCEKMSIPVFRGDEHDVLGRYVQAAQWCDADPVVRLTADCPMHDAEIIDDALEMYCAGGFDYVSNAIRRTFPDGLDVEVMSRAVLDRTSAEATHPSLREHVTTYIRGSRSDLPKGDFRTGDLLFSEDLGLLRWTLDTPEDLVLIRDFFERLPEGFGWRDALALMAEDERNEQKNV